MLYQAGCRRGHLFAPLPHDTYVGMERLLERDAGKLRSVPRLRGKLARKHRDAEPTRDCGDERLMA
jgi:hypothetical protein